MKTHPRIFWKVRRNFDILNKILLQPEYENLSEIRKTQKLKLQQFLNFQISGKSKNLCLETKSIDGHTET